MQNLTSENEPTFTETQNNVPNVNFPTIQSSVEAHVDSKETASGYTSFPELTEHNTPKDIAGGQGFEHFENINTFADVSDDDKNCTNPFNSMITDPNTIEMNNTSSKLRSINPFSDDFKHNPTNPFSSSSPLNPFAKAEVPKDNDPFQSIEGITGVYGSTSPSDGGDEENRGSDLLRDDDEVGDVENDQEKNKSLNPFIAEGFGGSNQQNGGNDNGGSYEQMRARFGIDSNDSMKHKQNNSDDAWGDDDDGWSDTHDRERYQAASDGDDDDGNKWEDSDEEKEGAKVVTKLNVKLNKQCYVSCSFYYLKEQIEKKKNKQSLKELLTDWDDKKIDKYRHGQVVIIKFKKFKKVALVRLTESLEEKKALDFNDVDENMDETLLPKAWLPFNCLIPIEDSGINDDWGNVDVYDSLGPNWIDL